MTPRDRLTMERDISLLADPEIDVALGRSEREGGWTFLVVRRRGRDLTDPLFRFRDPDRA